MNGTPRAARSENKDEGVRMKSFSAIAPGLTMLVTCAVIAQDFGDTPYVQTPQNLVYQMLHIAKVRPADYVIDLGFSDGRIVVTAAQNYHARGFGVDLD